LWFKRIIRIKYKKSSSSIEEAFDFQPKALKYLVESKHATMEIINREDHIGYRLFDKLRRLYSDLDKLENISSLKLTQYNNDLVTEDNQSVCRICYTYLTKIVFDCYHTACVGCAFKLKECHQCRKEIKEKNIMFS